MTPENIKRRYEAAYKADPEAAAVALFAAAARLSYNEVSQLPRINVTRYRFEVVMAAIKAADHAEG